MAFKHSRGVAGVCVSRTRVLVRDELEDAVKKEQTRWGTARA